MQFKSERFWSITSARFFVASTLATLLLLGVFSKPSLAVITVNPISKVNGNTLGNRLNGTFYFPYIYTVSGQTDFPGGSTVSIPASGVIDPNASFIDLGQDPNPSAAGGVPAQAGIIYFNVSSPFTATASQAVIVAEVNTGPAGTSGVTSYLAPIISVNGGFCNTSSCVQGPGTQAGAFGTYYFGANYSSGQLMTIGISPQAICKSVYVNGTQYSTTVSGCDSYPMGSTTVSSTPTTMNISFEIFNQSDLQNQISANPVPFVPPSTTPLDGPASVPLGFESLSLIVNPSPNPSPTPEEQCVFQDQMVIAAQGGMTLNTSNSIFTITGDPISNDPAQIIVIAAPSPGATLQAAATDYLQNSTQAGPFPGVVATPVPAGGSVNVSGFQNSTPQDTFFYTVGFLVEDPAGFVFDPGSSNLNSCTLPFSFDTSDVQGFLNQSKCFIATAAFRSMDSAPLVLLRAFRDNFLEHFGLGQSFVHWYYGWSPDAAEWLIDHPIFRFPVLLALIPLQVFAWMVLHPLLLLLLFMSSVMIFCLSLLRQSEVKIGRSAE